MVVWGGSQADGTTLNTGGRYDPVRDTWATTSLDGAPSGRRDHTAVWTGSLVLIWGGLEIDMYGTHLNTGGRYNPATDTWTPMSIEGAPLARREHWAIWTGFIVQIQNRGREAEEITDPVMLGRLISLTAESTGGCPPPTAALEPPARFPLRIRPRRILSVPFAVAFDCANDPDRSSNQNPGHEDYRFVAVLNRSVLDGLADGRSTDDVCPRSMLPRFEFGPNSECAIRDLGCGAKKLDGTLGADVLADIVVR